RIDRIVQSPLGILLGMRRQRIVDLDWPALFLECCQDPLLVDRRHFELLDYDLTHTKFLPLTVPFWHEFATAAISTCCRRQSCCLIARGQRNQLATRKCKPFFAEHDACIL